jgi:uncharacterized protein YggE
VQRLLFSVLLLVLAALPAAAQTTQQPGSSEGPVVVASGEGSVKRAPDRAWLQVTTESRAKNPREAQKLNADVMSAVLQKLRGAGLKDDAIQTRGYDLQPEYDYNNGRQALRGYVARNSLEVRVDELTRVGDLLDLAVTSGATSVGNVRFDLKDRAGAEREALRLAVEDARKRADAAASGAGMKVERIVRIEEHRANVYPPPMPMQAAFRTGVAAEANAAPPVAPGELEIRASVTVVAAIR